MRGKDPKQNLILCVTHPELLSKMGLNQPNWADWEGKKGGQSLKEDESRCSQEGDERS